MVQYLSAAAAVILILFGASSCLEARSNLIIAQARADLIRAQADALWWQSVTPITTVVIVSVLSFIAFVIWIKYRPAPTAEKIIGRQSTIYVISEGTPRREIRQLAVEQRDPLLLTAGRNEKTFVERL